jgi:hypothetical protein
MITSPAVTYILHGVLGILLALILTLIGSALGINFALSILIAVAISGVVMWLFLVFHQEPPE